MSGNEEPCGVTSSTGLTKLLEPLHLSSSDGIATTVSSLGALEDEVGKEESTLTIMLLDGSGSMYQFRKAVVGVCEEYLAGQKASMESGAEVEVRVFGGKDDTFEVRHEIIIPQQSLSSAIFVAESYVAEGITPLNDAIKMAISEHTDRKKVLCYIITDGQNKGGTSKASEVKEMVCEQKKRGWKFLITGPIEYKSQADILGIDEYTGFKTGDMSSLRASVTKASTSSTSHRSIMSSSSSSSSSSYISAENEDHSD